MNSTNKTNRKFEEMTARIIAQLEKGTVPWRRTWNRVVMGPGRNHFSGHVYTGINRFLLNGYEIPRFATFKQVSDAGHRIRKGAKSSPVYFWKMLFFDKDGRKVETRREAEKVVPYVAEYRVFNVLDIEGFTREMFLGEPIEKPAARIDTCEQILAQNPHRSQPGEPAYNSFFDLVKMPDLQEFTSPEEYYLTYFHELSHWTGHPSRLNRELGNRFASEPYSREELIAEMSACFLSAHCGIVMEDLVQNSAAYLNSWINTLQGDARLLMSAASAAEKAANFLIHAGNVELSAPAGEYLEAA